MTIILPQQKFFSGECETNDYYVYYRQNCTIPLILLFFSSVLCFLQIYSLWKERLTYSAKDIMVSILFLCIARK